MFVTFRGFSSQKLHLSSSAQCALYLTGGRREKDRNLAIWDREGGRIKSGQGEEIKVVTTLDEIFSFLCLRCVAIFLHVFLYFRVSSIISYSWAFQIILSQKWKCRLYYEPYSTYQIRYLPFWATSKDIFLSRKQIFRLKASIFHREEGGDLIYGQM